MVHGTEQTEPEVWVLALTGLACIALCVVNLLVPEHGAREVAPWVGACSLVLAVLLRRARTPLAAMRAVLPRAAPCAAGRLGPGQ